MKAEQKILITQIDELKNMSIQVNKIWSVSARKRRKMVETWKQKANDSIYLFPTGNGVFYADYRRKLTDSDVGIIDLGI
jgi:hypothetical protein